MSQPIHSATLLATGGNDMSNLPDISSTTTSTSDANTLHTTPPLPPLSSDNNTNNPNYRPTLNGAWVLDRNRGSPSAKGFLQTMSLSDHAIEANEKGDQEHDTIHDISLTSQHFSITKTSRVNDLTLNVTLGQEHLETMERVEDKYSKESATAKMDRWKKTMATSEHLGHVRVETSMPTINGIARVLDVKTLVQETIPINGGISTITNPSSLVDQLPQQQETQSIYTQHLTIWNETTGNKCDTTIRHFRPYHGQTRPTALTAGGKKRKQDFETIPTGNNGLEYDVVAAAAVAATSSPDTSQGKGKRKHSSR